MSLLPATSHANPTTPFWAAAGSGGGGGVTGVFAGSGINVNTNTGDVTVSNGGVLTLTGGAGINVDNSTGDVTITNTNSGVETIIGEVNTGSNTTGIDDGDTWTIGTFKQTTFYSTENNFYIAGLTVNISQIISTIPNYDGNLWLTLEYSDGVTTALQGRETINIVHTSDNYYSGSVVIAFQHVSGGVLTAQITNRSGAKLNSLDYAITSFYCANTGTTGSINNPLF